MTTRPQGLISATDRPLRMRMRRDLAIQRQSYQGRDYWIIKDPLAQKYYRFEEEEFALLKMLDGKISLAELQANFEKQFPPQKIRLQELHQLVGMLHRNSLVIADAAGQGGELLKRHQQRLQRQRLGAVSNVLCVRWKGFDPDHLLGWLNLRLGCFLSAGWVLFVSLLAGGALLLVGVHFDSFRARLPAFHEFFAAGNWIWLAATLAVTKILHEFGHGLACKRFGGECHEMGLMLLVLTPCLYCNVSDSWMLPSKWKRAAIGAAGMYVEMALAAAATYVWWFSQPGLLNFLALNTMFVCSVSTLLFNANPLMRYDGYYILADLVEIPNLRQKASTILQRKLGAWLLGLPQTPDPFLPQRHQLLFASYAIAAAIYRWFVVLGILWFLYQVFEPWGLKVVGQILAAAASYGLFIQPLVRVAKFFHVPGRYEQVNWTRFGGAVFGFAAVLAILFGVPTPHFVRCDVYLQSREATVAYVETPGILREIHVGPGQWVRAGDPLVTLHNVDVELEVTRRFNERLQLQAKLASLRRRAFAEESALLEIAEVEELLAGVTEQLRNRQQDREKLQIEAPRDGCVLPMPRPSRDAVEEQSLPQRTGSPLQLQNLLAYLDTGEAVCQIGDPQRLEAILAIDQTDIEFVQPGQSVEIVLDAQPGEVRESVLTQLAQLDMDVSPTSLSNKAGGDLITQTDSRGRERPLSTTYRASAPLQDLDERLFRGATGRARIRAGRQTVAQRVWRFVCQTFTFEA